MPNQTNSSSIETGCGSLAAAAAALSDTFQTAFDLWIREEDGWRMLSLAGPPGADRWETSLLAAERLAQAANDDFPPQLHPLDDGRTLLVVPIDQGGEPPAAATAAIETGEPQLVEQLARLLLRDFKSTEQVKQLREENDVFAEQVSENFEELVLLRHMAEHLKVVDASKDVLQMAETVLPLLAQSVRAENITIVEAIRAAKPSGDQVIVAAEPVLWHGFHNVDLAACRGLVERYHSACLRQPVVKNFFHQTPEGAEFPGVHEFVLIPMVRNEQVQSWLLALNRTNGHGLANGDFAEPCSSLEFGTDEATLLSVAAAMLSTHAGNIELFREKERLLTDVVSALVYAIEAKDNYTCGHSQRVASFGKSLARHCGLDEENCDRVYLAGLLHDVGKIGVNDAALKKPGALTPEEYAEIKKHPDGAWAILQTLKPLEYILPGVLFHHERFDGKGYPDGLAGNEIPLAGRILAVTDSYDAMTSDRPYRKGMPPEKAAAILSQGAGSQWDPTVVEAFLHILPDIVQTQNAFRPPARPQRAKGAVEATNCQPQSGWQMGNGKWRSGNGGWGAWSGGSAAGVAR